MMIEEFIEKVRKAVPYTTNIRRWRSKYKSNEAIIDCDVINIFSPQSAASLCIVCRSDSFAIARHYSVYSDERNGYKSHVPSLSIPCISSLGILSISEKYVEIMARRLTILIEHPLCVLIRKYPGRHKQLLWHLAQLDGPSLIACVEAILKIQIKYRDTSFWCHQQNVLRLAGKVGVKSQVLAMKTRALLSVRAAKELLR